MTSLEPTGTEHGLGAGAVAFLQQKGCSGNTVVPLRGGANNRVFRVPRPGGGDWVIKCYFQNPGDPRDRFGAEQAFYDWVWSQGIRRTPQPLAWCTRERLGLFTFIAGRKLRPDEVVAARIQEALDFVAELNLAREQPTAGHLPAASEACFSLSEHLACVDRRVSRLQQIAAPDAAHEQARSFVEKELSPAWSSTRASILREATRFSLTLEQPLPVPYRCLSPSDFGFHNAMLDASDSLRFLDFEYAGWDDPAKLVCDFFCQPELPVGSGFWDRVLGELAGRMRADRAFPVRAQLLLPAYQIKWCCIMLNEFVNTGHSRRAFSVGAEATASRREQQLDKARQALRKTVELGFGGGYK